VVFLLLDVPEMSECYLQPIIFNLGFTLMFGYEGGEREEREGGEG
jgi:hypothetical protein